MVKPNHICKYSGCKLGKDEHGNPCRKHYYACDYCDRTANWKSMACCFEHYQLYIEEVVRNRAQNKKINPLPERTDISNDELSELMKQPIDSVKEKTEKELSAYINEGESFNVSNVVEKINQEIDEENSTQNRNCVNRRKGRKK